MADHHDILPEGTALYSGEFTITRKLAEGGFGITYLAEQHDALAGTASTVVIKEFFMDGCERLGDSMGVTTTRKLKPATFEKLRAGFIEEARLLYRFGHIQDIVNVRKFFEENNTAYFVMEFISGGTLEEYLRQQPENRLSEAEALQFLRPIAHALEALHQENIAHRDLKPQNILLREDQSPVLIDFGIAREYVDDETAYSSLIVNTKGYAPLEQYSQSARRGPFTDIYSLGAIAYRMLTGKVPPPATDLVLSPLKAPQQLAPHISDAMNAAILKAMEIKYEQRFQTTENFLLAAEGENVEDERTIFFDASEEEETKVFHEEPSPAPEEDKTAIFEEDEYDFVGDFYNDLAVVRKGERYGFINRNKSLVVPLKYNYARAFSEERAVVKLFKYGYIDVSGEEIIPLIYDVAHDFEKDKALVKQEKETFFISRGGGGIKERTS